MKKGLVLVFLFTCLNVFGESGIFPYPVHKKTLANGLDVIVIETPEFRNVLSYNTLVLAGARNEIEEGETGLAHLFEHILFRHRWQGEPDGYDRRINEMGAFNNAFTTFDITYYHPLTFTENLHSREGRPGLAELEADRFVNLDFTEEIFRTEAGAVLGEYRRFASDPRLRIEERVLELAFPDHSYGHTTIGYLEDIRNMPNLYEPALAFYRDYYRPNNVVLIVAGDVEAEEIFQLAERLYGEWEPGEQPEIPAPGPVGGPKTAQVEWEAEVAPRIAYTYRVPEFRPGTAESAVAMLLPELLAGDTAPLFRKLRFEKETASGVFLSPYNFESFDPRFAELSVTLFREQHAEKGEAYYQDVVSDVQQAFQDLHRFSEDSEAAGMLRDLMSKIRYDLLAQLSSPAALAQMFAWYYRFDRDPQVFDVMIEALDRVQPSDIDAFARRYFTPENRVVVTLVPVGGSDE
jgi:zinc protease